MSHIIFLYRKSRISWGSTTMRAHQLAQMIAPYLPSTTVQLQPFSRHYVFQKIWARFVPQGAMVFATKGVVKAMYAETVRLLRKRGCRVCLDVVDIRRDQWPGSDMDVDCFISPSISGIVRLQAHVHANWGGGSRPLVAPVLHNADQRLYGRKIHASDDARAVYWGDVRNAVNTSRISESVTFLDGASAVGFSTTLDQVLNYNVHYAVRPTDPEDWRIKPFTKGVNAAVLGAIVMADRAVPDAIDFLGSDYPFLIPSNSEAEVLDGLRHLRESFGGSEWQLAQSRCLDMAERVSPMALAAQITHIMKELQG
jgi:hypothetical protein